MINKFPAIYSLSLFMVGDRPTYADVLDGLLLPAVLGGSAVGLYWSAGHVGTQHQHVGTDLETGHVLLQRQAELFAHHNDTE